MSTPSHEGTQRRLLPLMEIAGGKKGPEERKKGPKRKSNRIRRDARLRGELKVPSGAVKTNCSRFPSAVRVLR